MGISNDSCESEVKTVRMKVRAARPGSVYASNCDGNIWIWIRGPVEPWWSPTSRSGGG
jgi:hypothetical protein